MKLGKVALERALSKMGLASRTQTRKWIIEGKLKVNGKIIKNPFCLVSPEKDKFVLDGKLLKKSSQQMVILYKPRSVVTTRCDERNRHTVFDLLPKELKNFHAVGRLDMATSGLLLLTNDTKLSNYLTDPANAILRAYVVVVRGKVTDKELQEITSGIWDKGEFLKPARIILRKESNKELHLIVELTEGKNREIRRLFKSIGHEVIQLKRISFGNVKLGEIKPGEFRYLTPEEIKTLSNSSRTI